ncbi:MAG TPA: 3-oxoacyl-ACP reductase FabG [Labilithrix sp.]|nr:3-oxoacyl-ACP reductase FabG [Labilithrix sp.]
MDRSQPRARRALVTGASRGIGAAVARVLARDGFDVVLNCKTNVELAERVADDVRSFGRSATVKAFDVTDAAATARALEELMDPGIDVLVNNAGITRDGPFPTTEPDAWASVIGTTLGGFYNVTRPLVMPMVQRRWGRIINVSSVSGVIGNRGQVNYAAAKAGLVGATKALAMEVAKRNVTVNAVAPGLIDTDMAKAAPVSEVLKHVPMRRLGRADEVAELVAFLASDRAAYITGQVIGISGGLG